MQSCLSLLFIRGLILPELLAQLNINKKNKKNKNKKGYLHPKEIHRHSKTQSCDLIHLCEES